MNDISNINGVFQQPPSSVARRVVAELPSETGRQALDDEVEISDVGALLSRARELPEVRLDRISRLKAEIDSGTFETPERLEGTVERLLAELQE
ncbi:MAG TPA: flagellar biosynthesis anti-sigma factor FlgM [Phycisphaerae bacterium]|nr:flagellar biosynthesis anti-sigma factor FlgM [Phycisphaerae bacterium]